MLNNDRATGACHLIGLAPWSMAVIGIPKYILITSGVKGMPPLGGIPLRGREGVTVAFPPVLKKTIGFLLSHAL